MNKPEKEIEARRGNTTKKVLQSPVHRGKVALMSIVCNRKGEARMHATRGKCLGTLEGREAVPK